MAARMLTLTLVTAVLAPIAGLGATTGDVQTTRPDACVVLQRGTVAKHLGRRVIAIPEKFPMPRPAKGESINSVLDVSETACTWFDPSTLAASCAADDNGDGAPPASCKIETITIRVYERNDEYTGPDPWSDAKAHLIPVMLGSGRLSYTLISNDKVAKQYRAPELAGEDVFIAVDRKTRGRRIAMMSYIAQDGLVFMFTSLSERRLKALDTLVAVTRRVVA